MLIKLYNKSRFIYVVTKTKYEKNSQIFLIFFVKDFIYFISKPVNYVSCGMKGFQKSVTDIQTYLQTD